MILDKNRLLSSGYLREADLTVNDELKENSEPPLKLKCLCFGKLKIV